MQPEQEARVAIGYLQQAHLVLLSTVKRGFGLGVYAQNVARQKVIHSLLGLASGDNGDYSPRELNQWQIGYTLFIKLAIYLFSHRICLQYAKL